MVRPGSAGKARRSGFPLWQRAGLPPRMLARRGERHYNRRWNQTAAGRHMRILFITSTRIGDAVLSTGILGHLLDAHPQARVTVACGPAAAPLFAAVPNLEAVIPLVKRRRGRHWFDLWRRCVGRRWSILVDLRRSAMRFTLLSGRRYVLPADRPDRHKVLQLSDALGLAEPAPPRLWIGEADRAQAAALIPDGSPVLAIAPTANWGGKQWLASRFATLIARLTATGGILPGARVAIFASAEEREIAMPVLESVPEARRLDLAGRTTLPVAAACLERCAFFVGNDSALMHMAAATGIPTLGLFGPSRDEHYGPWGQRAAAVRTDLSYEEIIGSCLYDYRSQATQMGSLSVDKAVAAAEALWHRSPE